MRQMTASVAREVHPQTLGGSAKMSTRANKKNLCASEVGFVRQMLASVAREVHPQTQGGSAEVSTRSKNCALI